MHCVLGVCRQLLRLWLQSQNHDSLYYMGTQELRAWLIYYSAAALYGILPEQCYQHYLLLFEGIHLLLSEVTGSDLYQS
uniref:Uncharacterized protein n=1 Tax=Amphimedon queenslandica TaxID=400682 RepID=A0A1X7UAB6_AMPQE